MDLIVGWVVGALGIVLMFLIGAVWQIVTTKILAAELETARLDVALNDFRVEVAKEYVSRQTLRDMLDQIMNELRKIDEAQKRLFERLDSKADRP